MNRPRRRDGESVILDKSMVSAGRASRDCWLSRDVTQGSATPHVTLGSAPVTNSDDAREIIELARQRFETLHERRLRGDRLQRFAGWYDPATRRPNNGFPALRDL